MEEKKMREMLLPLQDVVSHRAHPQSEQTTCLSHPQLSLAPYFCIISQTLSLSLSLKPYFSTLSQTLSPSLSNPIFVFYLKSYLFPYTVAAKDVARMPLR